MECRCYHGGEGRTKLHVLRYRPSDFVAIFSVIVFGAAIVLINVYGLGYSL
jgi:energy-coupling factor transport system permease protein